MSYRTIRSAQKEIWPAVCRSLDLQRASRKAVENDRFATAAAKTRAKVPWNRVVANETVWALAKAELLNTPEQAAVIQAARAWARDLGPELKSYPDDFDPCEHALYDAIQALGAAIDPPNGEDFPE